VVITTITIDSVYTVRVAGSPTADPRFSRHSPTPTPTPTILAQRFVTRLATIAHAASTSAVIKANAGAADRRSQPETSSGREYRSRQDSRCQADSGKRDSGRALRSVPAGASGPARCG
jgi:hypothetical protein